MAKREELGVDLSFVERDMKRHPENYFDPTETDRRMGEVMRRLSGLPHAMNMLTGQNLQPPFLSEAELKQRGYPCTCGFE